MNLTTNIYELFASALTYPNEAIRKKIEQINSLLVKAYPEASLVFSDFSEFAKTISLWKWEEIYTRTFDVQSISTLDLGYILFGDDYKRGELLVNLGKEHKAANIDCGIELADHLPNVLRLLIKLEDNEIKQDLVQLIIKPALKKIISEFEIDKIDKKNKVYKKHHKILLQEEKKFGIIYQSFLKSLLIVLNNDFPGTITSVIFEGQSNINFANEMEVPE